MQDSATIRQNCPNFWFFLLFVVSAMIVKLQFCSKLIAIVVVTDIA